MREPVAKNSERKRQDPLIARVRSQLRDLLGDKLTNETKLAKEAGVLQPAVHFFFSDPPQLLNPPPAFLDALCKVAGRRITDLLADALPPTPEWQAKDWEEQQLLKAYRDLSPSQRATLLQHVSDQARDSRELAAARAALQTRPPDGTAPDGPEVAPDTRRTRGTRPK